MRIVSDCYSVIKCNCECAIYILNEEGSIHAVYTQYLQWQHRRCSWRIWHHFHSKQSQTDMCLVHFINSCMKVADRWMCHLLNIQCVGVWKRKMILFKRHTTIHALVLEKLLPASTSNMCVSGKHDTTKDCIQNIPSKYSTLNLGTCEEGRAFTTGLLHTHICTIPVYSLMKNIIITTRRISPFAGPWESTRNTVVLQNIQHQFSVKCVVWYCW